MKKWVFPIVFLVGIQLTAAVYKAKVREDHERSKAVSSVENQTEELAGKVFEYFESYKRMPFYTNEFPIPRTTPANENVQDNAMVRYYTDGLTYGLIVHRGFDGRFDFSIVRYLSEKDRLKYIRSLQASPRYYRNTKALPQGDFISGLYRKGKYVYTVNWDGVVQNEWVGCGLAPSERIREERMEGVRNKYRL